MKRTQIYLDEETLNFVKEKSMMENKTMSEVIRESIRERISKKNNDIIMRMNSVFGIWKDRVFDVDEFIRDMRKDREL